MRKVTLYITTGGFAHWLNAALLFHTISVGLVLNSYNLNSQLVWQSGAQYSVQSASDMPHIQHFESLGLPPLYRYYKNFVM